MSENTYSKTCPTCGAIMIKRVGKFGPFYSCSNWPRCKQKPVSIKADKTAITAPISTPTKKITLSVEQQNIVSAVESALKSNTITAIMVNATAGSGKTTLGEYIVRYVVPASESVLFVSFARKISAEIKARCADLTNVTAGTLHSTGLKAYSGFNGRKPRVDQYKVYGITNNLLQDDSEKKLIPPTSKLIGLLKNSATRAKDINDDLLTDLCLFYNIDIPEDKVERVFYLVKTSMEVSEVDKSNIDFDDMLFMPVIYGASFPKYRVIIVDEAQDMNSVQMTMIERCIGHNTVVIFIGDKFQSIFGFRGAGINTMAELSENFACVQYPLSVTRRCPKSHVDNVNSLLPEIPFKALDSAKRGEITSVLESAMQYQDGDLILCRCNAPLIKPAMQLLAAGRKAVIYGKDLGQNLVSFMAKCGVNATDTTLVMGEKLDEFFSVESEKLAAKHKADMIEILADKIDTLKAIGTGLKLVENVIEKISEIFSDDNGDGVIFSTVHKAKGLEAENVGILYPALMPHKAAAQEWEQQQERNLMFVAYTRAKNNLTLILEEKKKK